MSPNHKLTNSLIHQLTNSPTQGTAHMFSTFKKMNLPTSAEALPGRSEKMLVPGQHAVNGAPLEPPFPAGLEQATFGM